MSSIVAGAILLVLTGPEWSQLNTSGGRSGLGFPLGEKRREPGPLREQHDEAYKSAIEKIPPKKPKRSDPWSGVRSKTTQDQKTGR